MAVFSVVLVTAAPFLAGDDPAAALNKIDGREALLRSVEMFLNRDEIKQIVLVVPTENLEDVKKKHGAHLGFSGVKLVGAGKKFGEQLAVAAEKLPAEPTHVLVHDVARCCVPYTDVDALLTMHTGKAAITALSSNITSSLVQLDEGGSPVGLVSVKEYAQLLTPMLITKAKFAELVAAKREPHASELTLLKGSPLNIRLSGPGDASLVKAMVNLLPKPKPRAAASPFDEAQW